MSAPKSHDAKRNKSSESEQTVVLLGVAAMLLVTVIYVWLDLPPAVLNE
jgi:hypothetical protein